MTLQQIEREKVLVEIIAERDGMIKNLLLEGARQSERIKTLEAEASAPKKNKEE